MIATRLKAALLTATLCGVLAACGHGDDSLSKRASRDETVDMSDDDPAMARAFQQAKASLDSFLALAEKTPAGEGVFALKVRIRNGNDTEYFWVDRFTHSEESFQGTIENDGELVRTIRAGQAYHFMKSDIVDWMQVEGGSGKMHGNYTACALLTRESPAEAEEFRRRYKLDCPS